MFFFCDLLALARITITKKTRRDYELKKPERVLNINSVVLYKKGHFYSPWVGSIFFLATQPKSTQVILTSIRCYSNLLANEIQYMSN